MITHDQLKLLYPRASGAVLSAFATQAPELFAKFGIDRLRIRQEFFLAQLGHESGGLMITEENMNYSAERLIVVWPSRFPTVAAAAPFARNPEKLANKVYSGRMGNGPPESGDGFRFRGRGCIQITGRDGYRQVGARAGIDLETQPERAAAVADQLHVACAFWKWKDVNPLCDSGDFVAVTKRINGGTIGMEDRRAWLDKVRRVLATPLIPREPPAAETVRAVQKALRARGFVSIGTADGDLGPKTAAAIALFRQRNSLGDGLIDDRLLEILDID